MRVISQDRASRDPTARYEDGGRPRVPTPVPPPAPAADPQEKLLRGLQQVLADVVKSTAKNTADVCAALVKEKAPDSGDEEWAFDVTRHPEKGWITNVRAKRVR